MELSRFPAFCVSALNICLFQGSYLFNLLFHKVVPNIRRIYGDAFCIPDTENKCFLFLD